MPTTAPTAAERLYDLRELAELGYGSRRANQSLIREGRVPAVLVGKAYKIAESDLHLLTRPAGPATEPVDSDPDTLAARLVSTWPRLSEARKTELGRLLSNTR